MKKIFLAIIVFLSSCHIGTSSIGEVIGYLDVEHFKAVKLFAVKDRIFLFGNIISPDLISKLKYGTAFESEVVYVVYELKDGVFLEKSRGGGEITDVILDNNSFYLSINQGTELSEIFIYELNSDIKKIWTLDGRCRKFAKNDRSHFIFILDSKIVVTNNFSKIEYDKEFDYVGTKYDEIFCLKNGDFLFKSNKKIYTYILSSNGLLVEEMNGLEYLYINKKNDLMVKSIYVNDEKFKIEVSLGSRNVISFIVNLETINKIRTSSSILISGRDSSFRTIYYIYSMNGEKVSRFSPKIGGDWPYFVTNDHYIISYSSKMLQRIKLPEVY